MQILDRYFTKNVHYSRVDEFVEKMKNDGYMVVGVGKVINSKGKIDEDEGLVSLIAIRV